MSHWEATGQSNEWYTPKWLFDALDCQFNLDVAPASNGKGHVPAREGLTEGLHEPWFGFVWMNPPFGGRNGIEPWLAKFFEHHNGIALTPDRTSAPWFQYYGRKADLLLFLPKVKFERPDGSLGRSPSNGTCLMGIGRKAIYALRGAAKIGLLTTPTDVFSFPLNNPNVSPRLEWARKP